MGFDTRVMLFGHKLGKLFQLSCEARPLPHGPGSARRQGQTPLPHKLGHMRWLRRARLVLGESNMASCPSCLPASSKPFQGGLMRVRSPKVHPGQNVAATPGYVQAVLLASLSPREARPSAPSNSGWGRGEEGERWGKSGRGRGAGSSPQSPGAISQVNPGQKLSSSPKDACPTASGAPPSGIRPTQTDGMHS